MFHVQCSGLNKAPEGEEDWFCPVCKVGEGRGEDGGVVGERGDMGGDCMWGGGGWGGAGERGEGYEQLTSYSVTVVLASQLLWLC